MWHAWLTIVILLVLICILVFGILLRSTVQRVISPKIQAQEFITAREQKMFFQLVKTFPSPEYFIFAQVAFSALLWARKIEVRNTFNRKRVDFVLTDKALQVLAIIELDDSSHIGREAEDAARDKMLSRAGYRVVRFPTIPVQRELRAFKSTL